MSSAEDLMDLVRWQLSFGARVPGSAAHERFRHALAEEVEKRSGRCRVQRFSVRLGGRLVECSNVITWFGASEDAGGAHRRGALLLGTHFDTRARADREPKPAQRERPIPGANDGGSGTAVLLDLLDEFRRSPPDRNVVVAFFDAEDVGGLDGNGFAVGAEVFARSPVPERPGEVVVLDMVGGAEMILDIDANTLKHPGSASLTMRVRGIGRAAGYPPFLRWKPGKIKGIVADHTPFLRRGIPATILIDIDYPPWHTHGDLPEAMSEESLRMIRQVVLTSVSNRGIEQPGN